MSTRMKLTRRTALAGFAAVKIDGWILGDTEGRLYALATHA
jgi:hypothetical protein